MRSSALIRLECMEGELTDIIRDLHETCDKICKQQVNFIQLNLSVGVLISSPHGCLRAEAIAGMPGCDFVCFDLQRLTELTCGIDEATLSTVNTVRLFAF